jgi:hypothetical protein
MLASGHREHLWEGFWAMIGAVIAVGRSATEALYRAFAATPAEALDVGHLADVILFFGSLFVAVALLTVVIGRGRDATRGRGLLAQLRDRTAEETRHRSS